MAEQEIKYIPYGLDEISQLDLMTSLANGIDSYLGNKRWARKDKYRNAWLAAYLDIINRGLLGASNESGVWKINHEGEEIPMNEKSNIEREMYGDAAYYIRQLMSRITPRKKEEEDKKKNLDKFDFYNTFHEKFMEPYFGKDELFSDPELGWNALDKRQDNGLRLTANRRLAMLKVLREYLKDLDSKEYNFEESGFKDKEDVRTKIEAAIKALDTDSEEDDFPAFNALGLKYRSYFSNGGADINPVTGVSYEQEAQQLQQKLDEEAKVKAALEAKLSLANRGVLTYSTNNNAIDAIHNVQGYLNWILQKYDPQNGGMTAFNNRLQALLEKSYNQGKGNGLSSLERKELGNMIHYVRTNNPKYLQYNLTSEDEGYLNTQDFKGLQGKRINDFVRLPFQTSDGRYIYSDKSGNVYFLKPKNQAKLTTSPTFNKNRMLEYNDYIKGFGKSERLNKLDNEYTHLIGEGGENLTSADYAILGSILGDTISAGASFAPGYGTAISAATGIGATGALLYADLTKGENVWTSLGHAGFGIGMDLLGLIPGVGVAGKAAKMAKNISKVARWLGPTLAAASALSWGPNAKVAFDKIMSGDYDKISGQELLDLAYGLRTILAGGRHIGSVRANNVAMTKAKNAGRVIEGKPSIESATVTTKEGKIIKVTEEQVKQLRSKTASRQTKDEVLRKAAYDLGNPLSKNDGLIYEGRSIKHPLTSKESSSKVKTSSITSSKTLAGKYTWTLPEYYTGKRRFSNENFLRHYTSMNPELTTPGWLKRWWTGEEIPISSTSKQNTPKISGYLENLRKPSVLSSNLEVIQHGNLPQPQEPKLNIRKPIETKYFKTKTELFPKDVKELNLFQDVYYNGKGMRHSGYGEVNYSNYSKSIKPNELTFDLGNGKSITFRVSKEELKNTTPAKITQIRKRNAELVLKLINEGTPAKKIGAMLRKLKQLGFLKHGGTLDTTIENFFKNNNNI